MADKPIIFSAPMVRALLDGRKTQTRRALKPQLGDIAQAFEFVPGKWRFVGHDGMRVHQSFRPPCAPGDRLWVREAWAPESVDAEEGLYRPDYRATANGQPTDSRWRLSIHMPRWASRLTLFVTDVRVQRLQDIGGQDCWAEGIEYAGWDCDKYGSVTHCFRDLWNSLHGPDAWDANPWVCALTFTVHRRNIDQMGTG